MGTLDNVRGGLLQIRRMPHGGERVCLAAVNVSRALEIQRELERRGFLHHPPPGLAGPYDDAIEEMKDLVHRLCIACPQADPTAVWRGWAAVWSERPQRVAVVRSGQMVLRRRGRARVEDAYSLIVDRAIVGRSPKAATMKQARWACLVGADGRLPAVETASGRRLRTLLYLARQDNAIVRRDFGPKRRAARRRYELRIRQLAARMSAGQIAQAKAIQMAAPLAMLTIGRRGEHVRILDVLRAARPSSSPDRGDGSRG